MSARKLGRKVAGLFVALGLLFGGSLVASSAGNGAVLAVSAPAVAAVEQIEFEWG